MARYIDLDKLIVKARAIDPPHNFQHERRDIVEYIYASWNHLLKAFYNDDAGAAGFAIIDTGSLENAPLKPCPICGSGASIGREVAGVAGDRIGYFVHCERCWLSTPTLFGVSSACDFIELIEAWNNRVTPDA